MSSDENKTRVGENGVLGDPFKSNGRTVTFIPFGILKKSNCDIDSLVHFEFVRQRNCNWVTCILFL